MPISVVPEGSVLGRDIVSARNDALPLLRSGQSLTADYLARLTRDGINAVYVEDTASEGILAEPLVTPATRATATRAVAQAYDSARATFLTGRPLAPDLSKRMSSVVEQILTEVAHSDGAATALVDLAGADAYTFQHSIDVTALGLLIGQKLFRERGWLDYQGRRQHRDIDERLFLLGMGLLLHDIGKLAIPVEVLQKPGKLSTEEWETIKRHPRLGIDLLREGDWSPLIQAVVLRHHERWDGTGYPDGRQGEEIHEMARIAAVADVYDAVTSARVYSPARPPHVGVRVVLEEAGSSFDPDIAEIFRRLVPPFPPGSDIKLADGREAIVVSIPPDQPDRPLVRVLEDGEPVYELALTDDDSLQIAGWEPQVLSASVGG